MPLARKPGMITLHGGMPNPSTFPFASMAITLTDGSVLNLEGADVRLRWVAPVAIAPHVGSLLYCLNSLANSVGCGVTRGSSTRRSSTVKRPASPILSPVFVT